MKGQFFLNIRKLLASIYFVACTLNSMTFLHARRFSSLFFFVSIYKHDKYVYFMPDLYIAYNSTNFLVIKRST